MDNILLDGVSCDKKNEHYADFLVLYKDHFLAFLNQESLMRRRPLTQKLWQKAPSLTHFLVATHLSTTLQNS